MQDVKMSDIVDTAIQREKEAYAFYMDIHGQVKEDSVKDTLIFIAGEEKKHREFLENYRDGKWGAASLRMNEVIDYNIAEYLAEPELEEDMNREQVYLIAAHRELRSYKFYTDLANLHTDGELNEMLIKIASEELKHKEKMEYLYANTAFPQTDGG